MVAYSEISHGSWSCRWGDWMIFISEQSAGWSVVVWELPVGISMAKRKRIGSASAMDTSRDAVLFACEILRHQGVTLLVSGQRQPLEKFFNFHPAPQEVS